jgi:NitT/TauT family transport system substrate-binding protein
MRTTIIALLIAVAFSLAGIAGCSGKEDQNAAKQDEKITIAVATWPGSAALYVAHEKGYFRNEGLDATLQSCAAGTLAIDSVFSGKADLATAGDTPITRAVVNGKPLAVVATTAEIERAVLIIARKDTGILTAGDLKGKRIGVVAGSGAEFFLHIYLVTSHIDPDDVRIIDTPPDKVVGALLNGEVDAVSTWAPYTIMLREKLAGNALIFQDPGIYSNTFNIVATQDFVKSNPDLVRKVLRAVLRANSFIKKHPDETRAISATYIGADSLLYEKEWEDYRFTAVLEQSLILNLEDQARWMIKKEAGSTRSLPNFMDFIYADALKAVQPEAVRIVGK